MASSFDDLDPCVKWPLEPAGPAHHDQVYISSKLYWIEALGAVLGVSLERAPIRL